jgi:hypothetical protein
MPKATAFLAALVSSLWLTSLSAQAGFPDCADPSYRAQFDPRLETIPYDCVERLRIDVPTGSGVSEMRLIHDRNAAWALSPGVVEEFERGLRASADALELIGPFRLDHVTVLLIDGLPPREGSSEDFSNIAAQAGASHSECRIGIYLLSAAGRMEHAASVVAHELFHCVQEATLSAAQMRSSGGGTGAGGDWWLEGSAEWFAALALPELGPLADRLARFDDVSDDTPLYEMAYEAVVFFLWLNDEKGPASIMPFLRGMAGSAGAGAQRSAMQGALGEDEWLTFAEAYIDRRIKHPHGTAISVNPSDGDTWRWTETRTQRIALQPFVIRRGWIEFDCGKWATGVRPDRSYAARSEGGSWGDLPDPIDTNAGDDARFRFVGFAARSSDLTLRVRGDLEAGCQPCGGSAAIDACLVGTWQQTGGGPVEWMQRVMSRRFIAHGERRNVVTVYQSDGTYASAPLTVELTTHMETRRGVVRGDGHAVAQGAGRWSAEGGRLNVCQDRLRFHGTTTMTAPDGSRTTMPVPMPRGSGTVTMQYACSRTSLETTLTFPGIPQPMVTQYSRISRTRE